jgi:hypothetical protein
LGANGYRPPDDDRVVAKTDILGDLPQRHAREDLIPIIARASQNASNVNPVYFEYFQRIKTGRRCSCWTVEAEPQGICPCCFGTGIVGGYNKRNTKTHVFDVTYPGVGTANVTPDYNAPTRPCYWSLIKTAVFGTLDFEVPLARNIGQLDLLDIKDWSPEGTEITYWVKSPSEADYSRMTEATIALRLGQRKLQFRVVMKRVSPTSPFPKLVCLRIAYRLKPQTEVRVNIPRVQESLTLEEFGIYQSFNSQTFWLDNTLRNISTEDWLYSTLDATRWKVIEVTDNKPAGILTSWDLTCRLIQTFESYAIVPLGTVVQRKLPEFVKSIQTDKEEEDFIAKSGANHLRKPGHRSETSTPDGPSVTTPGQTDVSTPLREV